MKRIACVAAIIVGVLLVADGVAPMVIGAVLRMQVSSSVGSIGGADGPTAIVVAGTLGAGQVIVKMLVGILFIVAGIWGYRKNKK